MKVREIRYLCVPYLLVEIYPLGMYGTGQVYFRGLVEDIPKILFDEDVMSILPLDWNEQGISIEYDENIMKECTSSKKEDDNDESRKTDTVSGHIPKTDRTGGREDSAERF